MYTVMFEGGKYKPNFEYDIIYYLKAKKGKQVYVSEYTEKKGITMEPILSDKPTVNFKSLEAAYGAYGVLNTQNVKLTKWVIIEIDNSKGETEYLIDD